MFVDDKDLVGGGCYQKDFFTDKMKANCFQWQTSVSLTQINDNRLIKGNTAVRTFKFFFPFLSCNKHVAN